MKYTQLSSFMKCSLLLDGPMEAHSLRYNQGLAGEAGEEVTNLGLQLAATHAN
jgi:hypothetical protein